MNGEGQNRTSTTICKTQLKHSDTVEMLQDSKPGQAVENTSHKQTTEIS